ncbi:prolyl oligopeptidase family serine peptidase [Sphingobium yanoikuyae]|uniref:prolyl oligopeptidase family serine peptidase n=1 Tax=Sphingobium yanoikuyae TaxID=13690 RepID=UPI0004E29A65|nr:prolyl oligopeptidase family serine peptidase [Sphingobium yanoikuyae]KFD26161.1 prolyl oligopeptidase [Sphingobium yanoikuyae]MDV3480833.1 prolyl oligopeptidase family serine peptidase [Sphingobium yanoikuyae]
MLMRVGTCLTILLTLAAAQPMVGRAVAAQGRFWTMDDILAIPAVAGTALADDGRTLAYILRVANRKENRTEFELHVTNFQPDGDRILARSIWMERLQAVPGKMAWSLLIDQGQGVQLYQFGNNGAMQALVVNPEPVLVGSADGAQFGYGFTGPVRFGLAYYDWSPDGRRLFYSLLRAEDEKGEIRHDEDVTRLTIYRRRGPRVTAHFFLKEDGGPPLWIADVSGPDRVGRYMGGMPIWHDDALDYALQADNLNVPHIQRYRWRFEDRKSRPLDEGPALFADRIAGPHDGTVAIERVNQQRRLRERTIDGRLIDYGVLDATLSDARSPGHWRSPDGSVALIAVRFTSAGRYGLIRLDTAGRVARIEVPESLTHCSFAPSLSVGVCAREGVTRAPSFVRVTVGTGRIEALQPLSPRHDAITPLRVETRILTNAYGYRARSLIIYPRAYESGQRYPAVLVTHGSDADERFGSKDIQWDYPIQLFAERGYMVILANEPDVSQSDELVKASADRNMCGGATPPAEIQRLGWLNQLESFRVILHALDTEGLIDPRHVGIAGYSYGSQIANVAVTQADLFSAASSGDGGFLEPTSYRTHQCVYRAIYGGAPGDPVAQPNYAALAPSYRARFAQAPVLQQIAEPHESAIDFHQALRAAQIPSEISLYPGESWASDETHFFHLPSNQLGAMAENLEWFDYWLRDLPPSAGPDGARRARWEAMRLARPKSGDR